MENNEFNQNPNNQFNQAPNDQNQYAQQNQYGAQGSQVEYNQSSPQYSVNNNNPEAKSKLVAGLLGIFLGGLGVHNFYLGYTKKGLAQVLISVLSCGFLAAASSIWGLVEGIMILTGSINVDGKGNPLKD